MAQLENGSTEEDTPRGGGAFYQRSPAIAQQRGPRGWRGLTFVALTGVPSVIVADKADDECFESFRVFSLRWDALYINSGGGCYYGNWGN